MAYTEEQVRELMILAAIKVSGKEDVFSLNKYSWYREAGERVADEVLAEYKQRNQ